jgi:hypothetical protein
MDKTKFFYVRDIYLIWTQLVAKMVTFYIAVFSAALKAAMCIEFIYGNILAATKDNYSYFKR